ncbi:putative ribonuclease H-like domain-containing protein [Tanacetum coccineum]
MIVRTPDFKLTDESHVLLKVPRKDNMYNVDLKNVVPQGGLTCLFTKATSDESNLWHRRLGHVNFKTMNKLVKGNLVRGLPLKLFEINQTCVACQKGKQHKASCKTKTVSSIRQPLQMLHMDLFGPTFVKSLMKKMYCLVVTDDFSRVLVIKLHNKTPYELFLGRKPALSFMRPFGYPVTILNTIDHLVVAGNQSNGNTSTKACADAGKAREETLPGKDYTLLPLWTQDSPFSSSLKDSPNAGFKPSGEEEKKDTEDPGNEGGIPSTEEPRINQEKDASVNSTNNINTVSPTVNAASIEDNAVDENIVYGCADDPNIPDLEEIGRFSDAENDDSGADINNLDTYFQVSHVPTTRIHKDHPLNQVIRDLQSATQTRQMTKNLEEYGFEELLQFKLQEVWTLVELPNGKRAIGTKLVYRNKKDEERGKMTRLSLTRRDKWDNSVSSYMMSDYYPIFGSTKKSLCTDFKKMTHKKFQMSSMGELTFFQGLQVKQKENEIFISQDKYVTEILKKFGFSDVKTASTPMETHKPLLKDTDGEDVDDTLFKVNPKSSHLHGVKKIFRYLKGQPKLGLWYPKDSPFNLVAYTDSDYVGASLDRKSTTGGCQFLGYKLISWQCKKQTVVANFTTEAEYIAASNCSGHVLWIQNQLMDYGYNFMKTKIHIDNESTIYIVKNPVFHSKIKHIEIRHHFIRDSNKKKLIQMIKIHTDQNVTDLLTKAFDVSRFEYLIVSIGMLNL